MVLIHQLLWTQRPFEEKVSDTVEPCDTTQARSDSDFGVRVSTV